MMTLLFVVIAIVGVPIGAGMMTDSVVVVIVVVVGVTSILRESGGGGAIVTAAGEDPKDEGLPMLMGVEATVVGGGTMLDAVETASKWRLALMLMGVERCGGLTTPTAAGEGGEAGGVRAVRRDSFC